MRQRESIIDAARGRWHGILTAFGVPAGVTSGKHQPCPFCGGNDRFRFTDKDGEGRWICNQCGSGSGFDFVQKLRGCDFPEAARIVREVVRSAPVRSSKPVVSGDTKRALNSLWRSSKPVVSGDPVSLWLTHRIGPVVSPPSLRFCANARYWDDEKRAASTHPAMVAMIHSPDGTPGLLHKTYLTQDGRKAQVEKVRMLMPGEFPKGGSVRLCEPASTMGIAEGIETAFAASLLFHLPVWASLNAGSLEKWQPPAEANEIIIFGDNDANFVGQRAAYSLGQRLSREGLAVTVKIPPVTGTDWNNVLSEKNARAA